MLLLVQILATTYSSDEIHLINKLNPIISIISFIYSLYYLLNNPLKGCIYLLFSNFCSFNITFNVNKSHKAQSPKSSLQGPVQPLRDIETPLIDDSPNNFSIRFHQEFFSSLSDFPARFFGFYDQTDTIT